MSLEIADQFTKIVLYEDLLAKKNWNFGGLKPRDEILTECLVESNENTELKIRVRFLHLLAHDPDVKKEDWDDDGNRGLEREVELPLFRMKFLLKAAHSYPFAFHPVTGEPKLDAFLQEPIYGRIELSAIRVARGLVKISIRLSNTNEEEIHTEPEAWLRTMMAAHVLFEATGGRFVSSLNPPEARARFVKKLKNEGVYPVLLGPKKDGSVLLSSAYALYDYPEIAPDTQCYMFECDDIGEALGSRVFEDDDRDGDFQIGDRVRIVSKPMSAALGTPNGDVFDLALAGLTARIEGVEYSVEGGTFLKVTFEDELGREIDLGEPPGHRYFFKPHEVERL